MVLELDRRYPGLDRQIEESMAVAIDGEIFQDAYLVPLKPESEIYLIPQNRRRVTGLEGKSRAARNPTVTYCSRWRACSRVRPGCRCPNGAAPPGPYPQNRGPS